MNKIIITIGRQFGCGGRLIGKLVAEQLGIGYYDKDLLQLAAKQHGFSAEIFERADEKKSLQTGFLNWLNGHFSGNGNSQNFMSNEALFKMQSDVIRSLAETESCVIVGRCSDYILRNNPHHFSIFLRANLEERIARVAQRMNISVEKAKEMIQNAEKSRADYYNYFSSKTWGAVETYDICINVSLLGTDKTADLIAKIAQKKLATTTE